jgi:hypothetical protein
MVRMLLAREVSCFIVVVDLMIVGERQRLGSIMVRMEMNHRRRQTSAEPEHKELRRGLDTWEQRPMVIGEVRL